MSNFETIRLEVEDGIATLTLNRPDKLNAFNTQMMQEMIAANAAMLAPTMIFAVTMWIFRVPFALALEPYLGASAIWWSFPVGSISSALLAFAYYRWGRWRQNRPILSETDASSAGREDGES